MLRSTGEDRKVLSGALMPNLDAADEPICEFAAFALTQVLCGDLIRGNELPTMFALFHHHDFRVRAASMGAIKDAVQASVDFRNRLAAAKFMSIILPLLQRPVADTLAFASQHTIPFLGPSLVRQGDATILLALLSHGESGVRIAATVALRAAAEFSEELRQALVEAHVITYLNQVLDKPEDFLLDFAVFIIPKLAISFAMVGQIDKLLDLLGYVSPFLSVFTRLNSVFPGTKRVVSPLRLLARSVSL